MKGQGYYFRLILRDLYLAPGFGPFLPPSGKKISVLLGVRYAKFVDITYKRFIKPLLLLDYVFYHSLQPPPVESQVSSLQSCSGGSTGSDSIRD